DKWARISVDDTENFEDLKESIGQKMSIYQKALSLTSKTLSQAIMSNEIAWCVICSPGPKWASKVLNKKEESKTLEEFFKIQKKILLLDNENPIEEWESHGKRLHKRCKILNELNLEKV
ncbi:aminopeptidase, partial [Borreliella garinii]|uniref:aminopeptidase n=1 Tax=Borreliella garinii TaxID=29519 RepID=UPI001AEFD968